VLPAAVVDTEVEEVLDAAAEEWKDGAAAAEVAAGSKSDGNENEVDGAAEVEVAVEGNAKAGSEEEEAEGADVEAIGGNVKLLVGAAEDEEEPAENENGVTELPSGAALVAADSEKVDEAGKAEREAAEEDGAKEKGVADDGKVLLVANEKGAAGVLDEAAGAKANEGNDAVEAAGGVCSSSAAGCSVSCWRGW